MVNDGAGPNNEFEPAKGHSYHSYVAMQEDTNAGLIGPTYIYPRGKMESVMASFREFPLLFMQYSETTSFMNKINTAGNSSSAWAHGNVSSWANSNTSSEGNQRMGGSMQFQDLLSPTANYGNRSIWESQITNLLSSSWNDAPTWDSVNGFVLSNNPIYDMCVDDDVIWYTYAYGSASHVFHMHGNGFEENGIFMPSMSINDGKVHTLVMSAAGVGQWQVICHVNGHNTYGMVANYRVYEDSCPLKPLAPTNFTLFGNASSY